MKMKIIFWDGISADSIKVQIFSEDKIIKEYQFLYGRDLGYGDKLPTGFEKIAPIVDEYGITDIEYAGRNVFLGRDFSEEKLNKRIEDFLAR